MSETCKWCGSACDDIVGLYSGFVCGSSVEHLRGGMWEQSDICKEICEYRKLLPLPQGEWGGEITPEVCRKLSMINDAEWVAQWTVPGTDISVWCFSDGGVQVNDYDGEDITTKTAGQLMFLVAARRLGGG